MNTACVFHNCTRLSQWKLGIVNFNNVRINIMCAQPDGTIGLVKVDITNNVSFFI